jgi:mannitol-1-phosphate/altronate dehydrogenase
MRNLDFKYLAAQNFLCFGPDGIELDLSDYGNVILVRGDNLDVRDEEERVASNGVGKKFYPRDHGLYALRQNH